MDYKLTSVKILKELYRNFKMNTLDDEFTLQKLVNRSMDLYLLDKNFKGQIKNWNNKDISFQLDHINGDSRDHRLKNLRFLCPNCHSQTKTWGTKRFKINKQCIDCGKSIKNCSTRCLQCSPKHRKKTQQNSKITWPPISDLMEMIRNSNYCAVGRHLGVSDNAIRKHIKNHPSGN